MSMDINEVRKQLRAIRDEFKAEGLSAESDYKYKLTQGARDRADGKAAAYANAEKEVQGLLNQLGDT